MTKVTEKQIEELLDKEAIRELMHTWFYLVDEGKAVEALDRFTTDDVTFDGGSLGKADSKEEWREMTKLMFRRNCSLPGIWSATTLLMLMVTRLPVNGI